MDISDWLGWFFLGMIALQALGLVPLVRRLRGPDPAPRSEARFDLLETAGSLLLFGGMLLTLTVAEFWLWLVLVGWLLMTAVYATRGFHWLRTRRRRPTP
ncbi:hypothetical protein [Streptomyces sp. CC208A]|uniref:hypothetical protein n=1 Tax=Streptomyces sp. CC208A TaxID=3044573 RepID=UPI0024A9AB50|nr:hypothetical protein [Streptomyces sp. CC208A]